MNHNTVKFRSAQGVTLPRLPVQLEVMRGAMLLALRRPVCEFTPDQPLKSLVVYGNLDQGDIAEEVQGVIKCLKLSRADIERLNNLLIIKRQAAKVGVAFTDWLREQISLHKPDLVWLDPVQPDLRRLAPELKLSPTLVERPDLDDRFGEYAAALMARAEIIQSLTLTKSFRIFSKREAALDCVRRAPLGP